MQGKRKITAKYILQSVNEWSIYKNYCPYAVLGEKFRSPFRERDKTPSMDLKEVGGKLKYKDWGNQKFTGDVFDFVQQMFGIEYHEALQKIAYDFGLGGENQQVAAKLYNNPKIEQGPSIIQVEVGKWTRKHKAFWEAYYLTHRELNCLPDTRVYPIQEWALNRLKMPLQDGEIAFAYYVEDIDKTKVYRPTRGKKEKWVTNIPYRRMLGLDNMKDCNVGIITKGLKDAAVLAKYITPCVSVVQGESDIAVTKENRDRITQSCRQVYVAYDSDSTGVEACTKLTQETGWGYINPPKHLLEHGVTDFSDMIKLLGPQAVIDFFRQKDVPLIYN